MPHVQHIPGGSTTSSRATKEKGKVWGSSRRFLRGVQEKQASTQGLRLQPEGGKTGVLTKQICLILALPSPKHPVEVSSCSIQRNLEKIHYIGHLLTSSLNADLLLFLNWEFPSYVKLKYPLLK